MKTETETALDIFTKAMDAKLKRHSKDRGESWLECDPQFLLDRLNGEYQEFLDSQLVIDRPFPEYDRKELVDIANFCMFLWYRDFMNEHENVFERITSN